MADDETKADTAEKVELLGSSNGDTETIRGNSDRTTLLEKRADAKIPLTKTGLALSVVAGLSTELSSSEAITSAIFNKGYELGAAMAKTNFANGVYNFPSNAIRGGYKLHITTIAEICAESFFSGLMYTSAAFGTRALYLRDYKKAGEYACYFIITLGCKVTNDFIVPFLDPSDAKNRGVGAGYETAYSYECNQAAPENFEPCSNRTNPDITNPNQGLQPPFWSSRATKVISLAATAGVSFFSAAKGVYDGRKFALQQQECDRLLAPHQ